MDKLVYFKRYLDKLSTRSYRKMRAGALTEITSLMEDIPYVNYKSTLQVIKKSNYSEYIHDAPFFILYYLLSKGVITQDDILTEKEKYEMCVLFAKNTEIMKRLKSYQVYLYAKKIAPAKVQLLLRLMHLPIKYLKDELPLIDDSIDIQDDSHIINESSDIPVDIVETEGDISGAL